MTPLAIIGGSGLTQLQDLRITERKVQKTPFGDPSGPLSFGRFAGRDVVFLPRHGHPHAIPPHRVNYRANIWALRENGVRRIVAVNAVGGISATMAPERIVVPDQLIDYTTGRAHTFFEDGLASVVHVDFTYPYSDTLREVLLRCAERLALNPATRVTYGATQGPRLESAAEIRRLERDGCDIVGMTGMPEAALARELELDYACIAVVANWAAGKGSGPITLEMMQSHLRCGLEHVARLLETAIPEL